MWLAQPAVTNDPDYSLPIKYYFLGKNCSVQEVAVLNFSRKQSFRRDDSSSFHFFICSFNKVAFNLNPRQAKIFSYSI